MTGMDTGTAGKYVDMVSGLIVSMNSVSRQ